MSEWLAVDLVGNVGFFDPQREGDVPDGAVRIDTLDTFALDALRFARTIARRKARTSSGPKTGRVLVVIDASHVEPPRSYREAPARPAFEDALGPSVWIVRDAGPRVLATSEPLPSASIAALELDPAVTALLDESEVRAALELARDTGVFRWRSRESDSDRYVRDEGPDAPIRAHELPIALRHAIERTRLRTSFSMQRDLSLRRALGRKRAAGRRRTPQTREERERQELVRRKRMKSELSDVARALGYVVIALFVALIAFLLAVALVPLGRHVSDRVSQPQ